MAECVQICSHCGKRGLKLKRCSVCKQEFYCGAQCQNANWKRHKKKCATQLNLEEVWEKVGDAHTARAWQGVLKWEGRLEQLMVDRSDKDGAMILSIFAVAHMKGVHSTGSKDHVLAFVSLEERRIPLLGKLQRFRDQGEYTLNPKP